MHYAGLRVRREIVIHVLFGRTKISYQNTLDIKQSFDLYVRSSGHTTPRVLSITLIYWFPFTNFDVWLIFVFIITSHLLAACLAAVTFTMEVQLGATGVQSGIITYS